MDLELDETQTLLRDTWREFLEREVDLDQVRACERERRADERLWDQLRELGWLATPFPSALGGGDGGRISAGLLVEEISRRAACVPVVETLACGLTLLRHGGDAGRAAARGIAAGEVVATPAILEADDRLDAPSLEVVGDGRLHGEKYFVDYAEFATHHLVSARRGGAAGLFWVDARDPAVKTEPRATIGRTPQSIARYEGVRAEPVCDAGGLAALIELARALTCVQIVSCMQISLEQTVAYTSVREQFGRPIGTFQAVQHHAANMAIEVESCRLLAYEALDALERGTSTPARVAAAKAAASIAAPEVTMLGHQLHGGQGYIEENDLYFYTLRARDRALAWGTPDECLEIVARTLEEPQDWL